MKWIKAGSGGDNASPRAAPSKVNPNHDQAPFAVAILQDLGYRVFEAADGEQGLKVFGEHSAEIDLLLTDVVLPGRYGGASSPTAWWCSGRR